MDFVLSCTPRLCSADFGLTRTMRQGHDLPMATEGGAGLAATWISGALSASAGHFMSGRSKGRGCVEPMSAFVCLVQVFFK